MTDTFENEKKRNNKWYHYKEWEDEKNHICEKVEKTGKKTQQTLCTFMSVRCTEKVPQQLRRTGLPLERSPHFGSMRFSIVLKRYSISQKCIRLRGKGSIPYAVIEFFGIVCRKMLQKSSKTGRTRAFGWWEVQEICRQFGNRVLCETTKWNIGYDCKIWSCRNIALFSV